MINKRGSMLIILISSMLLLLIQSTQNHNQDQDQHHKSLQQLTIHQNYYQLKFQYHTLQSQLPASFINLIKSNNVQSLILNMGYINPSYSNQNNQQQISTYPSIYHGISLFIQSNAHFTTNNFQVIANLFSISRSAQFMVYLSEINMTYASNPNDKFCGQHLTKIINLFLPCSTVSGIGSLINQRNFFIDKKFIGIKLQWNLNGMISLRFYVDRSSKQIKNFIRLPEERRFAKRCTLFKDFKVIKIGSIKNENQQQQIYESNKFKSIQFKVQTDLINPVIKNEIKSNYYSEQKFMKIKINLQKLSQILQFRSDRLNAFQLKYRLLFPKAFNIKKIEQYTLFGNRSSDTQQNDNNFGKKLQIVTDVQIREIKNNTAKFINNYGTFKASLDQSKKISISRSFQQIASNKNTLLTVDIDLLFTETLKHPENLMEQSFVILNVNYQSCLKPFQNYQTIAGGGEEFMNLPLLIKYYHASEYQNHTSIDHSQTDSIDLHVQTNQLQQNQKVNPKYIILQSNSNSNMFDRLLEPDFSIPFHTITFAVAIIGYLWIGIWRAIYKQISYEINNVRKSDQ